MASKAAKLSVILLAACSTANAAALPFFHRFQAPQVQEKQRVPHRLSHGIQVLGKRQAELEETATTVVVDVTTLEPEPTGDVAGEEVPVPEVFVDVPVPEPGTEPSTAEGETSEVPTPDVPGSAPGDGPISVDGPGPVDVVVPVSVPDILLPGPVFPGPPPPIPIFPIEGDTDVPVVSVSDPDPRNFFNSLIDFMDRYDLDGVLRGLFRGWLGDDNGDGDDNEEPATTIMSTLFLTPIQDTDTEVITGSVETTWPLPTAEITTEILPTETSGLPIPLFTDPAVSEVSNASVLTITALTSATPVEEPPLPTTSSEPDFHILPFPFPIVPENETLVINATAAFEEVSSAAVQPTQEPSTEPFYFPPYTYPPIPHMSLPVPWNVTAPIPTLVVEEPITLVDPTELPMSTEPITLVDPTELPMSTEPITLVDPTELPMSTEPDTMTIATVEPEPEPVVQTVRFTLPAGQSGVPVLILPFPTQTDDVGPIETLTIDEEGVPGTWSLLPENSTTMTISLTSTNFITEVVVEPTAISDPSTFGPYTNTTKAPAEATIEIPVPTGSDETEVLSIMPVEPTAILPVGTAVLSIQPLEPTAILLPVDESTAPTEEPTPISFPPPSIRPLPIASLLPTPQINTTTLTNSFTTPRIHPLRTICQNPLNKIRILSLPLLSSFYGPSAYPVLTPGFPDCVPADPDSSQALRAPGLLNCTALGREVQFCQQRGVQILLTVRGSGVGEVGGNFDYGLPDPLLPGDETAAFDPEEAGPFGPYFSDTAAAGLRRRQLPNLFTQSHSASAFALTLHSLFGEGHTERADLRPLGPDAPSEVSPDGIEWLARYRPLGEEVVVDGFDVQVPREWRGTWQGAQFEGLVARLRELNEEGWREGGGVWGGEGDLGRDGKGIVVFGWI